tara:strand:- start:8672 stop:10189 length:1518 start_codon:yes stop_codon:yes gene_type:complete
MNNVFFAYIRVSTLRQGQKGVSLQEQRDAIERYAAREQLTICQWFEERETAAKRGRSKFTEMLDRLRQNEARGVLIHKIDRSARNLRDWADLGELLDAGIEIRFVTESLDMTSRGGRLSADIQAVVAADYIRNLREETRKGFYGRLKQGIYPLTAPIGYLDNGGGKLKTPDPERAQFIRDAFALYATGSYTLHTLSDELHRRGLRSKAGRTLHFNRISEILSNSFYCGVIHIRTTGERFQGKHTPLIDQVLFDRVRAVLSGRFNVRTHQHRFAFKRLLRCAGCSRTLSGESQRGHVYYRCHTKTCRGVSVREETIDGVIRQRLKNLQLSDDDAALIEPHLPTTDAGWGEHTKLITSRLRLQIARDEARLEQLTDAMIDRLIDHDTYTVRRTKLFNKINQGKQDCQKFEHRRTELKDRVDAFIELWKRVHRAYLEGNNADRRDLLLTVSSNRIIAGKTVAIELQEPFTTIEKWLKNNVCGECCKKSRTISRTLCNMIQKKIKADIS